MQQQSAPRALDEEELARFRVTSATEILGLMRALNRRRTPLTLYYGGHDNFVVSSVLDVDTRELVLDCGAQSAANTALLAGKRVLAVAVLEHVKLEFALTDLRAVTLDDGPALQAAVPTTLLRLQRRSAFRVPTPVLNPILLQVPEQPDCPQAISPRISDISCGGVGLNCEPDTFPATTGLLLRGCRIDFPNGESLVSDIEVRHVESRTGLDGKPLVHIGMCFHHLTAHMDAIVQRYVLELERDRRSRT